MKVTFLNKSCEELSENETNIKNTILIQLEDKNFFINCNINVIDLLQDEGINNLDGVLLTNVLNDNISGLYELKDIMYNKTKVFLNKEQIDKIPKELKKNSNLSFFGLEPGCMLELSGLKVTPFKSSEEQSTAYLFSPDYARKNTVICCELSESIPEKSLNFFKNVHRYIFIENSSKVDPESIIQICKELKPKEVYFNLNSSSKFKEEIGNGTIVKVISDLYSFGEIKNYKEYVLGIIDEEKDLEEIHPEVELVKFDKTEDS